MFEVDTRLGLITCRRGAGEYTLGILNNCWAELPLQIESLCGPLESVRELLLDTSERRETGFVPAGLEGVALGTNTATTIAGGDIRIFAVRVKETGVAEFPHLAPGPRPKGVVLSLGNIPSIKEAILRRPTFFEHYDGVMVDWRYLHEREKDALAREARWLKRQGLVVTVDLSSGVNLYPDLRLLDNVHSDYEASMAAIGDVMAKMQVLDARQLVLSLHRLPENNYEGGWEGFDAALKRLAAEAARRGITLYLRQAPAKSPPDLFPMLARIGAANLRIAASPGSVDERTKPTVGIWLASSTRQIRERQSDGDIPVVLDMVSETWDEQYPGLQQ